MLQFAHKKLNVYQESIRFVTSKLNPKNLRIWHLQLRQSLANRSIVKRSIFDSIARFMINRFAGLWRDRNAKFSGSLGILVPIAMAMAFILPSSTEAETIIMPENFNWTGIYVGGFAGSATGAHITTTEPLRLDNNAFWFRPFHHSFSFKTKPSLIAGATVGYNWQIYGTPFLLGLEGEYGYLNLHRSKVDPNQFPYAALPNNNLQNSSQNVVHLGTSSGYGLIGGRIGYAKDRVLFYIKSGVVLLMFKGKYNSVKTEDLAPAYLNISGTKRIIGYGVGGGIEYALPFEALSDVSIKAEYIFIGFNKTKDIYGHCSCHFLWRIAERIRGVNTMKIGINYKF